jgi:hypothetical protein
MYNKMANKFLKKASKTAKEMTTNKYVLYTVLCFSIINILTFLITNNFIGLALFALIGLLTSYFTKNMTIILSVTLALSSILHISRVTVEAMTNKKKSEDEEPSKEDEPDSEDEDDDEDDDEEIKGDEPPMKKKHKLNHQATVQESYNNIHSILGSKKFKKMTDDTSKLLDQQNKLTESLNNMAPILKNAESMLGKFDMEQMSGMLDSLNLGPSSGKKKKN